MLPSIRQRKLIPIPAVVWRSGFLAGYDPGLDATAVSIGTKEQTISTIFVIPGQQGISAPGKLSRQCIGRVSLIRTSANHMPIRQKPQNIIEKPFQLIVSRPFLRRRRKNILSFNGNWKCIITHLDLS